MSGPGLEPSEADRLALVRGLSFLYSPQENSFVDITTLAARLLGAPIAFVSLVEEDRQLLTSCVGVTACSTPRDISICSHAITRPDLTVPFVVPDASIDPRFRDYAYVAAAPGVRMYVGQPLVIGGHAIGVLCVIDTKPRRPEPHQLDGLAVLARCVSTMIVARRDAEALRDRDFRHRAILQACSDSVVTLNDEGRLTWWNEAADLMFGLSLRVDGEPLFTSLIAPQPSAGPSFEARMREGLISGRRQQFRATMVRADNANFEAEVSLSTVANDAGLLHTVFVRDITEQLKRDTKLHEAETRDVVIFALARLAESRDPDTGEHLERVQAYCRTLAEQLRATGAFAGALDEEFIDLLHSTSPLHDIGKVGIPDAVLLKPGRLTPQETAVMQTHTGLGADTLAAAIERFPRTKFLRMARDIAATHHERFDGSGYPQGLAGEAIPLCGRIVALADVYDALTSRRVYKDAFTHEQARAIILKDSGRHFDPTIVAAFTAVEDKFQAIRRHFDPPVAASLAA